MSETIDMAKLAADALGMPPAKTAHTPGPWNANGEVIEVTGSDGKTDPLWCGDIHPTGKYRGAICRIQSADHLGSSAIGIAEAEANARLMAAAPDMYEALKKAESALIDAIEVVIGREVTERDITPPLHRVRAAIAKAEGR